MSVPIRATRPFRNPIIVATARDRPRSFSSTRRARDVRSASQSIPREPSRVPAARSTPKGTLLSFAAVLALALPYFISSKRSNDKKKRERHRQERQGGAMSQMASGVQIDMAQKTP
ncbi:BZ3500_MvSof-1268-A1-R1_Chr1-3g02229 [Microbotryum saponariae]|uniref:BZ3500_MvSof-1268-A1-R1_Chr1-3g02229 protein n=1 Tax=Microbotryum saponariae TaxID=289078 RepID=A0A2X0KPG7_9BASI|nr:BZ3500_MvSof-1268-A1-R1_Chr1-3g02229 [Microbotryum saponariae]SCZ95712.1 BZ3501_MvSof-1269-A2-R1_Chr1-3g01832 [Microbotryum saponariae]